MKAIRIIQDEHRALAAVLHGMLYHVHEIRDRAVSPHFELLGAMIYYIDAFPERFHHPKEDRYLFPLLRARHPSAGALLDRLEHEHVLGAEKIRTLEQALARYQQGGAGEFAQFLAAVEAYAAMHWDHMRSEEREMLPLAEKFLTANDWEVVDAAFLDHNDPMLGSAAGAHYDDLFRRIVNLAPPPLGVGPERAENLSSLTRHR
ncbi:MAG TPA: hemerythrin domain-containing protein [Casimicrobiaceae bacterium]|nr:hemerythrin domain-containing protein [Casimicrobiaceae bacterium]